MLADEATAMSPCYPLKLNSVGPGQYLDGRLPRKSILFLEELLV